MIGNHVVPPKLLEHGNIIQVFGSSNMRTVNHCLPLKDWGRPSLMRLGTMIYTAMPFISAVRGRSRRAAVITAADVPPITGGRRRLITPSDRQI
jgi:hypothetical protein